MIEKLLKKNKQYKINIQLSEEEQEELINTNLDNLINYQRTQRKNDLVRIDCQECRTVIVDGNKILVGNSDSISTLLDKKNISYLMFEGYKYLNFSQYSNETMIYKLKSKRIFKEAFCIELLCVTIALWCVFFLQKPDVLADFYLKAYGVYAAFMSAMCYLFNFATNIIRGSYFAVKYLYSRNIDKRIRLQL